MMGQVKVDAMLFQGVGTILQFVQKVCPVNIVE